MLDSIYEFFKTAINQQIVKDPVWATIALVGQFLFAGRFILQWIASEFKRKSYVPTGFWYLSIGGSVILFCYSIHIKNPIFMLSFFLSTMIYLRNLHLLYLESKRAAKIV
jgi:lipid-A-disaccharide synthase-like uncharacterized protein